MYSSSTTKVPHCKPHEDFVDWGEIDGCFPVATFSGDHHRTARCSYALCFYRPSTKSPLTSVCEVTVSLFLSAAPAVSPGRLRELGVTCVVNAASELPDTPLPNDREIAYLKVGVEDRPTADLLSHMDFVADMIEEVRPSSWVITCHGKHRTN